METTAAHLVDVISPARFTLDDVDVGDPRTWALENDLDVADLRDIAALQVGEALNLGGGAGATMTLVRTA